MCLQPGRDCPVRASPRPAGFDRAESHGMEIDADRLTVTLAARLGAIVPDGFYVSAADGMLWYAADSGRFPGQSSDCRVGRSGTYVGDNLRAHGETIEDQLTGIAMQAFDELQDYVDEASHDPWPGMRTPPRPLAEIRSGILYLWYGESDLTGPVALACEPIPLVEIQRDP
jgi:hypothetical protein